MENPIFFTKFRFIQKRVIVRELMVQNTSQKTVMSTLPTDSWVLVLISATFFPLHICLFIFWDIVIDLCLQVTIRCRKASPRLGNSSTAVGTLLFLIVYEKLKDSSYPYFSIIKIISNDSQALPWLIPTPQAILGTVWHLL